MEYVKSILDKSKYPHKLIHHKNLLRSAQEGAEYFNIDIGQTAPTLIVKTDIGFFVIIVSGSRGRVDFKQVAEILNCQIQKRLRIWAIP